MSARPRSPLAGLARLLGFGKPEARAPAVRLPPGPQPVTPEQQVAIDGNVALVQGDFAADTGVVFDFGRASLEYLDGFIRRQHERAEEAGNLPQIFGSYLGECIRQRDGGRWVLDPDGHVGIEIEPDFTVYPISKTEKHFANGDGDSILGFYDAIPGLLTAHRKGGLGRGG